MIVVLNLYKALLEGIKIKDIENPEQFFVIIVLLLKFAAFNLGFASILKYIHEYVFDVKMDGTIGNFLKQRLC